MAELSMAGIGREGTTNGQGVTELRKTMRVNWLKTRLRTEWTQEFSMVKDNKDEHIKKQAET